jgi:hypothetical protein
MRVSIRIAAVVALALLAACGDFFAPPAGAGLALELRQGEPSPQVTPSFDEVDEMSVRLSREDQTFLADSFAVFPSGGEIRRTLVVRLEEDEELLYLSVVLLSKGTVMYYGADSVRLVRGRQTAAQVPLFPMRNRGALAPPP